MSISQQALILIRLDARRGEVVPVAELAGHMGLSEDVVRQRIVELWHQGYVVPEQLGRNPSKGCGDELITGAMAAPQPTKAAA